MPAPTHISNVVPSVLIQAVTRTLVAELARRADEADALALSLSETGDGQAIGAAVTFRYWADAWRGMADVVARLSTPDDAHRALQALERATWPEFVVEKRLLGVAAAYTAHQLRRRLAA